jgi:Zn-finger nucleic acid-binding protein
MQCPVCKDVTLTMANRNDIEIDYCPRCRGVWLDRGELDKIIERSATASPPPAAAPGMRQPEPRHHYDDDRYDDDYYRKHGHKRRRGFLGDLFDFD